MPALRKHHATPEVSGASNVPAAAGRGVSHIAHSLYELRKGGSLSAGRRGRARESVKAGFLRGLKPEGNAFVGCETSILLDMSCYFGYGCPARIANAR